MTKYAVTPEILPLIARVCHEADRSYCEAIGVNTQRPWEQTEEWIQNAICRAVLKILCEEDNTSRLFCDICLAMARALNLPIIPSERILILIKDSDITKEIEKHLIDTDCRNWNGVKYARLGTFAQRKSYDEIFTTDIADSPRPIYAANLVKLPNGKILKNSKGKIGPTEQSS